MSKNRILSLVLALVMVLGAFGTVFADTVSPAKTQVEAAAFLKDKGVLAGNSAGDLMLEKELRRRDSVILFAKLLNEFDVAKEFAGEPTYTDIKKEDGSFKDPAYVPFLKWAQENEYYVGKPNGEFGWDANLTAQEYSKVLLVALGYTVNGEGSDVKWEEATNKAKDLGVFKGFEKVEETKEILRGEMALMTFNALGIKIKGTEQTLAAKLGIELPEADKPAELKIEKVYTENLAEVEIELSNASLVDTAKLENAANYRIAGASDEKIKVANAEVIGDNVRLTLVPYDRVDKIDFKDAALLKDRKYDLTIRNVDKRINEKVQKFTAIDNSIPKVEKVEFMGEYGIKVTTSEPIKNAEERFFEVDGKRTSMIVEQYGREIILTPYYDGAFSKDAKRLEIGRLEDFARFTAIANGYDLELAKEDVKPVVKTAYRNGNVLTVVFEEDVFHKSVKAESTRRDLGNVSFKDGRVTFYADTAKKIDTNIVRYEFKREIPRNVEVTISDVANHFNTKMETVNIVPELLKDDAIPYIIDPIERMNRVSYKEENGKVTASLEIEFDKDLRQDKINAKDIEDYFTLYELEVANRNKVTELIKTVSIKEDTVTVNFEGVKIQNPNKDNDYVLEVKKFEDQKGNRMETTYIDLEFDNKVDFAIKDIDVVESKEYSRSAEVKIYLNASVDKASAEEVNNYFFKVDGKGRADRAYVERDGKTISLLFIDKTVEQVQAFELMQITTNVKALNKRDTLTTQDSFWNLKTKKHAPTPTVPEVKSAITYINDNGYVDAAGNAVTVTLPAGNNVNYKLVGYAANGIDQITGANKTNTSTFSLTNAELGLTNVGTENKEVIVKAYKEKEAGKGNFEFVEEKTIYTKDMRTASLTSATFVGNEAADAVAAKKTIGGVDFEAVQAGAAGNNLKVEIVNAASGVDSQSSISFAINKLTVTIGYDQTGTAQRTIDGDGIQALIDANASAKVAIKASGNTNASVANEANLENGADAKVAVPYKATLIFTGADLKKVDTKVSMVIGGKNYANLDAKVIDGNTVEVTGFTDTVSGNITSVVGLETVNGSITDITGTVTLP